MISEILGYIGTILVLISFIPKDIKKIRIINIFGCIVWIISAVFSKSYSVMTLNSILMIVHIVHLIKMKNEYRIRADVTDEEIDKIRHAFCEERKVPYDYIYPNEEKGE